jgi:bacteriorhodopsin
MLRYIRWTLTFLVLPPLLFFLESVFQGNIQRFAADKQVHLLLTHWWLTLSELTNHIVGTRWFWYVFGFLSGAVAALWMIEWSSKLNHRGEGRR